VDSFSQGSVCGLTRIEVIGAKESRISVQRESNNFIQTSTLRSPKSSREYELKAQRAGAVSVVGGVGSERENKTGRWSEKGMWHISVICTSSPYDSARSKYGLFRASVQKQTA